MLRPPMYRTPMLRPSMYRTLAALLAVVVLAGACSTKPQSQASEQTAPPAASGAPGTTPPPAEPAATGEAPTPAPAATATAAPNPTLTPKPGIPPKPGNPTWTLLKQTPVASTGSILETYRATWTAPEGAADEFVLYGVEGCLRESKKTNDKPCVVKGMPIPKERLVKLGTAPGDAREMQISYEVGEAGPGPYGAFLVRAVNDAGKSIFTIVHSDDVCWRCTY